MNNWFDTYIQQQISAAALAEADSRALEQYKRLKTQWHLDLSDHSEVVMTDEKKLTYVRETITKLDAIKQTFIHIDALQQRFVVEEKHLEKYKKSQLPLQLKQQLHQALDAQVEEHYSLENYLFNLGQLDEPIAQPLMFFAVEHEHLLYVKKQLEQDITELKSARRRIDQHVSYRQYRPQTAGRARFPSRNQGSGDILIDVIEALGGMSDLREAENAWIGRLPKNIGQSIGRSPVSLGDVQKWGGSFSRVGSLSGLGKWGGGSFGKW